MSKSSPTEIKRNSTSKRRVLPPWNSRLHVWYQASTDVIAIWHVMPDDRVSIESRRPWVNDSLISSWVYIGEFDR